MTTEKNPRTLAYGWSDDVSDKELAHMVRAGYANGARLRTGALGELFCAIGRGITRLGKRRRRTERHEPSPPASH